MSGVDSSGFTPKTTEEIKTDLESGFRAVFGSAISVISQSVFGQIIGVFSDRLANLWQLGLALYNASFREGATGVQLDNIGALTGTARKQATYTEVTLLCEGDDTTVIPAGQLVSIPGVGSQFTNDDPGTISGTDVAILFHAVDTGPVTAYADTVTQIDTPVTGWDSVTNEADHSTLGSNVESDAAYRLRQVSELRAQGASTVAAIRAQIAALTNVIDVFVFDIVSDSTDVNGLPPHSFECVVDGGDEDEIALAIASYKPVGIATYGDETVTTEDANGFAIDINFSRPEDLELYIVINLTADSRFWPSNGADLVKAAIVALEDSYGIGDEFRASALIPSYVVNPAELGSGISGVLESALPLIGIAPSPGTSTTVSANNRQRVKLDTSRITVNVTLTIPT
jgi:uncharacterized phage protein gp47/JayE